MKTIIKQDPANEKDIFQFANSYRSKTLLEKSIGFSDMLRRLEENNQLTYRRMILSSTGRTVLIFDKKLQKERELLMFASNNYLGFATHPYIKEKVITAINKYGIGVGGPPLLNGYTILMNELEERISKLKKKEDTIIFSSGYSANVGLVSALSSNRNIFVLDKLSHASMYDGLKMNKATYKTFKHNDIVHLEKILSKLNRNNFDEVFVCIEGVYSMDGDLAPLPQILDLCRKYGAISVLDDAHGTGVLGDHGGGTAEFLKVEDKVDISMGTFSKAFALTGGFLSGDKALIDYIRYFSKPYVFSAALPPITLATLIAGLDLIEKEPWLRKRVLDNTRYAASKLDKFEFTAQPQAAIISIRVPKWINIRTANAKLDSMGIFLNAIEYPAVPINDQRFRISITAEHTEEDIDHLVTCLEEVMQ